MKNMVNSSSLLRTVASELPFFKTVEERELLLGIIGALVLRRISLSKAAEIMGLEKESFLSLLDAVNVNFSYLEESDVMIERE